MPSTSKATHPQRAKKLGTYISFPQAAELSSVSVRTLKRLSTSGPLPTYRVGRTRVYRVKTADVMALFERVDGGAAA